MSHNVNKQINWDIIFHPDFKSEFDNFESDLQDELISHLLVLKVFGPNLGRPLVDTLKGSKFKLIKELRFNYLNTVWRFLFAFDPKRQAIILVGGNKKGKNQKDFYKSLIKLADLRFNEH